MVKLNRKQLQEVAQQWSGALLFDGYGNYTIARTDGYFSFQDSFKPEDDDGTEVDFDVSFDEFDPQLDTKVDRFVNTIKESELSDDELSVIIRKLSDLKK